ncbi:hypothetical protein H1C71_026344, partial [Ictidomys tridecemlineatus]
EGLRAKDPISPPCSRPLGRSHRWGWAKGRALCLRPCSSANSAALPGAGGFPRLFCALWLGGGGGLGHRDKRRSGVFQGVRSQRGRRRSVLSPPAETATAGDCRPQERPTLGPHG